MKIIFAAAGFAGLLIAGSANATPGPGLLPGDPIFSSFVTSSFNNNSINLHAPLSPSQGGSPVAQEFTVATPTIINSLAFELSDTTPTDGGSILVYLVPNGVGNLPSASGITLTGATQLGTISDASLSTSPGVVTIQTGVSVAAGTDWIALVDASTSDGDLWYRTGDLIGLDVGNNVGNTDAGLYDAHVSPAQTLISVTGNSLELQIDAPEPASLAILGVGMAGVGFVRRRLTKNAV